MPPFQSVKYGYRARRGDCEYDGFKRRTATVRPPTPLPQRRVAARPGAPVRDNSHLALSTFQANLVPERAARAVLCRARRSSLFLLPRTASYRNQEGMPSVAAEMLTLALIMGTHYPHDL
jgi:hypothetical protein